MKTLKVTSYQELEKITENKEEELIVNLEDCDIKTRTRVIDFLAGYASRGGKLEKLNKDEFLISFK